LLSQSGVAPKSIVKYTVRWISAFGFASAGMTSKRRHRQGSVSMNSILSFADRLLRWSAVVLLLTLLASVLVGVISRQLNAPVAWSDELAQYLLVWTAFVGWIIASRRRSHIRITVLANKLPAPLGLALELLTQGLVVLFALVLLRYSFGLIDRTWDVESIALPITTAALYIVMPLAALALILQAIGDAALALAGRRVAAPEPGAQPL
jgi:TRAP-type C4-dicarboxylate transport system permease small subunit